MRFVLVHGGFHGAWCWQRLIPELARLGHEAIAIDLPGHGERRDEDPTLAERRDAIVAVLRPGDVLVGHSGGGYDITLAADAASDKVAHLVYLAAGLPIERRTMIEATGGATSRDEHGNVQVDKLMDDDTGMATSIRPDGHGKMEWVSREGARTFFYHDCDEATIDWAVSQFSNAPTGILRETISVPRFWKAGLPRSYVLCLQDKSKPRWMSDIVIRRLGVEPLTIDASHSPFLSKPAELAGILVRAVATRPIGPLLES